ncbi:hypothetical protein AGR9A_Cc210207 [Agrobacterium salinitolerans str. Hayward 0363]|nr:hypothetical protein AGR9A_Cc210207 [Agrobacterium salinitolerans str. Hayward 0363]
MSTVSTAFYCGEPERPPVHKLFLVMRDRLAQPLAEEPGVFRPPANGSEPVSEKEPHNALGRGPECRNLSLS